MRVDLAKLAREALASAEFKEFSDSLSTQPLPQSFGVLADPDLVRLLATDAQPGDLADWILRPLTWDVELYSPQAEFKPTDQLLHLLWQDLSTRLARKLEAVTRRTSIAPRGAVLCFFARAALCIIVEYRRSPGGAVALRPLTVRNNPNAVLDLSSMLDETDPAIRNAVKDAALSVDKLVFQRGSIIHVHRQAEDVFGPTIDTILLGELIAEWLDDRDQEAKLSALEVGPGSGLLSAILASSDYVAELTTIDLNAAAAVCTLKNLHINDITLDAVHQRIRVRAERFSPSQLTAPFDFIVCNPPYIPHQADSLAPSLSEYGRAVSGVGLCIELLGSLPKLLATNGVLLLMTSSLSHDQVVAAIPECFEVRPALVSGGLRVPLDVDIVWRKHAWRQQLLADGRIEQDEEQNLWHQLRPLWITRRAENS